MREIKANKTSFKKGHKKIGGISKGDHMTQEAINKISKSLQGKTGNKARRWLGDKAGYVAKHMWISKYYGKASKCENKTCIYPKYINNGRELLDKPRRFEWANLSGEYKRERNDYVSLCPSCHRKMDMGKMGVFL